MDPAVHNELLQQQKDRSWDAALGLVPGLSRPVVDVIEVVNTTEWAEAQASCMQSQGYDAEAVAGAVQFAAVTSR